MKRHFFYICLILFSCSCAREEEPLIGGEYPRLGISINSNLPFEEKSKVSIKILKVSTGLECFYYSSPREELVAGEMKIVWDKNTIQPNKIVPLSADTNGLEITDNYKKLLFVVKAPKFKEVRDKDQYFSYMITYDGKQVFEDSVSFYMSSVFDITLTAYKKDYAAFSKTGPYSFDMDIDLKKIIAENKAIAK